MFETISKEEYAKMSTEEKIEYFLQKEKDRTEGEISSIAVELSNALKDNELMKHTARILKRMCDRDGYGIYNEERSIYCGKFVWEYSNGDIKDMYSAFRDRNIIFENDIYGKIAEDDRKLLQMCRE